ncbi:MAG: RNA pseudouridine synthase, partial [Planctomycetes bacterium]|nr:RNA pseudouridine synthase [Planctomycetota bacterium]
MPQDEQDIDQSNEEARFSEPQVVRFTLRRRISGSRLDKYLHGRLPRLSRTMLQRLIRDGAVTVNGAPTKAS